MRAVQPIVLATLKGRTCSSVKIPRLVLEFLECASQFFRVEGDSLKLLCYPALLSPHNFRQDVAWKPLECATCECEQVESLEVAHGFQSASHPQCIGLDESCVASVLCLRFSLRVRTFSLQAPQKSFEITSHLLFASRFTRAATSVACRQHGSCSLL